MTDNGLAALAAEIDNHWLYRTDDMVFRCSFGDWEHTPDDTVAEGDRYEPFSAHIAAAILGERGVFLPDGLITRKVLRTWQEGAARDEATIATLRAALDGLDDTIMAGVRNYLRTAEKAWYGVDERSVDSADAEAAIERIVRAAAKEAGNG
jgi:hypothetical protein